MNRNEQDQGFLLLANCYQLQLSVQRLFLQPYSNKNYRLVHDAWKNSYLGCTMLAQLCHVQLLNMSVKKLFLQG